MAYHHRDVARVRAVREEARHLCPDRLGLAALARALQQADAIVQRHPVRGRLKQGGVQVTEGRVGGVPFGGLEPVLDLAALVDKLADQRGPGRQRAPVGVVERHRHVAALGELGDQLALGQRQVVEAVEEDGPRAPGAGA